MAIWFRLVLLSLVAFALSGCVLETKTPLFTDADAKLLLADYPNLVAYERGDGGWKKSDDKFELMPEASHYTLMAEKSNMQVYFVPIEGPWWVLQATEPTGATYVLAKAEPKELLIYPLDCKSLKEAGTFENDIEFKGSDCMVKDGADKMALFKSLSSIMLDASTKMVSEP